MFTSGARNPLAKGAGALIGIALLAGASVAACGPAATPVPTAAGPTATPATAARPAEPCATKPGADCSMFGGSYRSTKFSGGVAFTLPGDEWTNRANESDVLILFGGATSGFGAVPNELVTLVHGAPQLPNGAAFAPVSDPAQAKTMLGGIAGLTVTAAAGGAIAGQPGTVFRVANTGAAPITLWHYPSTTGAGSYDLAAGSTTEVHWLASGGAPVLVAIMAPTDKLDEWVSAVDVLIKSIRFG